MSDSFVQALIMAFREGLEALLIVAILIRFITSSGQARLKTGIFSGLGAGILVSLVFGFLLNTLLSSGGSDASAKLWESLTSLVAMGFITTFIIWMIHHSAQIRQHVEQQARQNLSARGLMLLTMVMVAREGAEIALFAFAGDYALLPIVLGILLAAAVVLLIHFSLIKIRLSTLFNLTLIYLILQSGFLLGYFIHEGLSSLKTLGLMGADHLLLERAFNLSGTILDHKTGALGIPLYVAFGWYSKPEWVQLIAQYGYTLALFGYWIRRRLSAGRLDQTRVS